MREFRVIDKNTKRALAVDMPLAMLAMDGRFFIFNQMTQQFIDMTKYVWIDQAIGINSQNGRSRVFENDIVEVDLMIPFGTGPDDPPVMMKAVGVVRYDYEMSGYGLDVISHDIKNLLSNGCRWFVNRTIGDVHRNQEILEQYKKSYVKA